MIHTARNSWLNIVFKFCLDLLTIIISDSKWETALQTSYEWTETFA